VYIYLNPGSNKYTGKSPCIFTVNQNHNGPFLSGVKFNTWSERVFIFLKIDCSRAEMFVQMLAKGRFTFYNSAISVIIGYIEVD
jgi:hypothetical protein